MNKFNELKNRRQRIMEHVHQVELQDSVHAGRRLLEIVYQVELDEIDEELKNISLKM